MGAFLSRLKRIAKVPKGLRITVVQVARGGLLFGHFGRNKILE